MDERSNANVKPVQPVESSLLVQEEVSQGWLVGRVEESDADDSESWSRPRQTKINLPTPSKWRPGIVTKYFVLGTSDAGADISERHLFRK